ncbi:MAG: ABC transporter permease, partial [Myxococcota bacterium]
DRAERRVASVVSAWSSRIANAELVLRGVAPNLVHPFSLQPVYVDSQSSPQRLASFFLLYVLLAPFLAGVGAATDSATAERERGTLQLMRLQPLIPWAWVFGKMLVVALFCWVGTAISIVVSLLALEALSPAAAEGWRFSADSISILLVAVTPMTLLASALLFAVALQARNTMEAQTRLTLTSVLPIAVGFWIIMAGPDVSSWSFLPFVHELDGLTRWMVGAAFPWTSAVLHFGLCAAGFVTVMVWGAQRIVSEDYLGSG